MLPWQQKAHSCPSPFQVWCCGRQVGKTTGGGREGALQAMVPGSRIWIAGPTMDLAEKEFRVLWDLTVDRETIPIKRKSQRELWIEFENGSFVECRTEENPDQLIGEGVDVLIMAEAARFKAITWEEQLRPTLAARRGKVIMSSTPRGYNWFYRVFMLGINDEPGWTSFHVPSWANPLLNPDEIARVKAAIAADPVGNVVLRQEWGAEFVSYAGQVFPEFTPDIHVRTETFNPLWRTFVWVDVGISNAYAVLLVQIDGDENIHVLDEIYKTGMVTPQILKLVRREWAPFLLEHEIPRQETLVVIDPAAADAISMWRTDGWNVWQGNKPPLAVGIDAYHRMLRDPYRQMPITDSNPLGIYPRITFSPRCTHTIEEHNKYHYPDETRRRGDVNASELPVDADNHSISAIRYGLYAVFPELFNEQMPFEQTILLSPAALGLHGLSDDSLGFRGSELRPDRSFSLGDY